MHLLKPAASISTSSDSIDLRRLPHNRTERNWRRPRSFPVMSRPLESAARLAISNSSRQYASALWRRRHPVLAARPPHDCLGFDAQQPWHPRGARRNFSVSSSARKEAAAPAQGAEAWKQGKRVLGSDDLFHPFSKSPVPEMRNRAAYIKQHAYCPHPDHKLTRLPSVVPKEGEETAKGGNLPPAHVHFECPDCGIPVYCSEGHWMEDYEDHLRICDTLREINEDDHDLRSGRVFPEFRFGDEQMPDAVVNLTNWDTYMYTRQFSAVNEERGMRHATRLLTYPVTVGSVLHELSPYDIKQGGRLTTEGLKSFSGRWP